MSIVMGQERSSEDIINECMVLSAIGKVKLAVTTSFSINFLYGASPADLLAEVGRRKKQQSDYRVDGWKPSLLERLARMLGLG